MDDDRLPLASPLPLSQPAVRALNENHYTSPHYLVPRDEREQGRHRRGPRVLAFAFVRRTRGGPGRRSRERVAGANRVHGRGIEVL